MIELLGYTTARKWIMLLLVVVLVLIVPYRVGDLVGEPCPTSKYVWAKSLTYQWHSHTYCNENVYRGITVPPPFSSNDPVSFPRFIIHIWYSNENEPTYNIVVLDTHRLDANGAEVPLTIFEWEW